MIDYATLVTGNSVRTDDVLERRRVRTAAWRTFLDGRLSGPRLSLERIVCPASKLEVPCIGRAAVGERDDVMEFQKTALSASSGRPHERAPSAVAGPDFSFHRSRNVT